MAKKPKWRIALCTANFYTVEVQADDVEEAVTTAKIYMKNFPDYFKTSSQEFLTGIFIDDSETSRYVPYVPDYLFSTIDDGEEL